MRDAADADVQTATPPRDARTNAGLASEQVRSSDRCTRRPLRRAPKLRRAVSLAYLVTRIKQLYLSNAMYTVPLGPVAMTPACAPDDGVQFDNALPGAVAIKKVGGVLFASIRPSPMFPPASR